MLSDFWADHYWGFQLTSSNSIYKLLLGDNGRPKKAGSFIKRPDYADVLDLIAEDPEAFYTRDEVLHDINNAVSLYYKHNRSEIDLY